MPMCLGMGGIDHEPLEIRLVNDRFEQLLPYPLVAPPAKAAMRVLPVTIFRRQITPWGSGTQNPDDGIDEGSIIFRHATPDADSSG